MSETAMAYAAEYVHRLEGDLAAARAALAVVEERLRVMEGRVTAGLDLADEWEGIGKKWTAMLDRHLTPQGEAMLDRAGRLRAVLRGDPDPDEDRDDFEPLPEDDEDDPEDDDDGNE